ncbi:methionyl aminopeptidase [Micromonospora sp. Llam0]|uniref:type I methionyl aminopeptidase n=1 Tax=Micromonosporaceae TaxID=28056 RepID=UPI000F47A293|nr:MULTISPECIES: type I methionyl aminopeptidase [Micromonosporaceae]ROO51863.1 methionyl aminopeptidase [Micromonospora sp. Llam0]WBC19757.1 type I methionyl aminopeptidase [Solwaraspora sp. WMMA2080]WJK32651.1 type I methionyl aminopeptidase [Solwaraspora sp. WMMA2065]
MRRQQLDIQLKTPEQIDRMRAAGLVVADALARMRAAIAPGVSTADLDAIAAATIRDAGAVPSFKGYHGYPATICSSVNEQVVHAIPAAGQVLRDGDVISVDCGAVLDGWHGDAAFTAPVGEVRPELLRMITVAEDALWAGIAAAARGAVSGRGRLTDISYAVERAIRAGGRYGIVEGYGGHGIGTEMHQDPHVLNYGRPGKGPRLVPGMALAIEPMITEGSARTDELADGWTVVTRDGSMAVHVEHSMALLPDGVWVLTEPDGGRSRLGDLVTARQPADSRR